MRRKGEGRRIMGILLAAALVAESQGMVVLAEEQNTGQSAYEEAFVGREMEKLQTEEVQQNEGTQKEDIPFTVRIQTPQRAAGKGSAASGAKLNFSNVTKSFNVADFGAKTSLADNYPAFQAALDAANEYQKSHPGEQCKVIIPAGTYKVAGASSHGLIVYSNTWISAKDAVIKRVSTYNWNLMQTKMSGGGYNVTENVLIEGGTWDGQGSVTRNTNAIFRFAHASNIAFVDCTIRDSYNAHMVELGGVQGFTSQNCIYKKYSENDASLKKEAIQLDICNNKSIMPGATNDDSLCGNVVITGCTFTDMCRAVGSHSAVVGKYYDNVTISNNSFVSLKGKAINTYNYRNCTISGNTFTNCSEAIDFRAMSMGKKYAGSYYAPVGGTIPVAGKLKANLLISNNTITKDTYSSHDAPETAVRVFGARVDQAYYQGGKLTVPAGNYYVEQVYIENNSISGKANGISLDNVRGAVLTKNTIYSCGRNGLQIADNSQVAVSGGNIHHNTRNGISNEKSTLKMYGGTRIYQNKMTGIYIFNKSKDVYIKDTASYSNQGAGCNFTGGSEGTLKNTSLKSNRHHGILVLEGAVVGIKGGKIEKNLVNGLNVIKAKVGISTSPVIAGNGGHGISLSEKSNASISKAYIKSNGKNGISMDDKSSLKITGSSITGNRKSGIFVTAGVLSAQKISVKSNRENGIGFSSYSKGTIISSNISKNGKTGITANNGKYCLKTNVIRDNVKSGVSFSSKARATSLEKNTFSNKGQNDIIISGGAKAPVKTTRAIWANAVSSSSGKITGKAHPKMNLVATVKGKKIGYGKGNNINGAFSFKIKKQKRNTYIVITGKDAKKNVFERVVKVTK